MGTKHDDMVDEETRELTPIGQEVLEAYARSIRALRDCEIAFVETPSPENMKALHGAIDTVTRIHRSMRAVERVENISDIAEAMSGDLVRFAHSKAIDEILGKRDDAGEPDNE